MTYEWNKVGPCTLRPHYVRFLKRSPLRKRMFIKFSFEMLQNSWLGSFVDQWEMSRQQENKDNDNNNIHKLLYKI